jgi:hypothetical protein
MTAIKAPVEMIRVAILVESLTVPEWVRWTVAQIEAEEGFSLVSVLLQSGSTECSSRRGEGTYRLYERLDRAVFGPASALRAVDLTPLVSARTEQAALDSVDIVLSFLPAERTRWHGARTRHGLWAMVPMDDGGSRGSASRFWELHNGEGVTGTSIVALTDGSRQVLARDSVRADALSLTRTRNLAAWGAAHLVLRTLRLLRRDGAPPTPRNDPVNEQHTPTAATTIGHVARTAIRGVAAKSRTIWSRDEWFVAARPRATHFEKTPLHVVPNPRGRFLGDPFLIEVDGRHFLFVEDYSYAAQRAVISVCEAGPGETWSPPRPVLDCGHHVSYPFVFEYGSAIYMIPETHQAERIGLYKAINFPHQWQLDRVLLDGIRAVDTTIHIETDRVWLFTNVLEGPEDRGELHLFSSRSLHGEWRSHPRNPIVSDPARARPAGRLFDRNGVLIRPSQDCSRGYGFAIRLNRVDVLSLSEYHETPLERIEPDWIPGLEATHTYTFDSHYECLDGRRHVGRLQTMIGQAFTRAHAPPRGAQSFPRTRVGLRSSASRSSDVAFESRRHRP